MHFLYPWKRFKYLRFYQRCLRCSWMICKNAVKQYASSNKNALVEMRPFETVFERLYFHERFRMFQCRWWQKRIKRYWCGGGLRVKSVVLVSLFTHQSNNWIFTLWHIDGNWRREIFKRYSWQESIMVETLNQKISLMRAGRLIWKISSVKEIFKWISWNFYWKRWTIH